MRVIVIVEVRHHGKGSVLLRVRGRHYLALSRRFHGLPCQCVRVVHARGQASVRDALLFLEDDLHLHLHALTLVKGVVARDAHLVLVHGYLRVVSRVEAVRVYLVYIVYAEVAVHLRLYLVRLVYRVVRIPHVSLGVRSHEHVHRDAVRELLNHILVVVVARSHERKLHEVRLGHVSELPYIHVGHRVSGKDEYQAVLALEHVLQFFVAVRLLSLFVVAASQDVVLAQYVIVAVRKLRKRVYRGDQARVVFEHVLLAENRGVYALYSGDGGHPLHAVQGREASVYVVCHVEVVVVLDHIVIALRHGVYVVHVVLGYIVRGEGPSELHQLLEYRVYVHLVGHLRYLHPRGRGHLVREIGVIEGGLRHGQRIPREHVVLHVVYVSGHSGGHRQNERHAYYPHARRHGHHYRPALLRKKVSE